MNKPIRAMSIFCMVLFVALLLNSTYLQYIKADDLNSRGDNKRVRDAEFSHKRGAILVGGQSVAESVPSKDQYKYQRTYRQPLKYSHLTGYYSYIYGSDALELTQNDILSGSDPRFFVDRVVDMIGNSQPKGGSVSLTIDPAAQNAAYAGLRALGSNVEGAVVAMEPSSGKILAMVSSPSYNPNQLSSHDFSAVQDNRERLLKNPARPMAEYASSGPSAFSGNRLGTIPLRSSSGVSPKPNFSAWSRSASSPSWSPRKPKETLHETISAWVSVIRLPPQSLPFSLGRLLSVCGRSREVPPLTRESGPY